MRIFKPFREPSLVLRIIDLIEYPADFAASLPDSPRPGDRQLQVLVSQDILIAVDRGGAAKSHGADRVAAIMGAKPWK
jgi:hypothetical protein